MDNIKNVQSMMMQGPIPGNSLTGEPGSVPWEQPPMLNSTEEAFDYYAEKISNEEVSDNLLDMLDMGVPISVVTNFLLSKGIMEGIHTVDVKLILKPQIGILLKEMAVEAGINFKETMMDYSDDTEIKRLNRLKKMGIKLQQRQMSKQGKQDAGDVMEQEIAEEITSEEKPQGLMAKE